MTGQHHPPHPEDERHDISRHQPTGSPGLDLQHLRTAHWPSYTHIYNHRDAILYALGLGFQDLQHLYERHPVFSVLPTYAIIAAHPALGCIPLEHHIPGFKRAKALHGEQYLRLLSPLPSRPDAQHRLVTEPRLVDVQDKGKGKGVVVVVRTITRDAELGHVVAENEFVAYGLGAGGFGSTAASPPAHRPAAATALNLPPQRPPDHEVTVSTHPDQAALYRLSGDYNALHIDPGVAKQVGFPAPILHGLCTLGMSVKAVVETTMGGDFSRLRTIKVRFAKHVFPGDTLRVRMWRCDATHASTSSSTAASSADGKLGAATQQQQQQQQQQHAPGTHERLQKVVFETVVVGREAKAISHAAVEFADGPLPSGPPAPHSRM